MLMAGSSKAPLYHCIGSERKELNHPLDKVLHQKRTMPCEFGLPPSPVWKLHLDQHTMIQE